jgi:ankyrin repeat protein
MTDTPAPSSPDDALSEALSDGDPQRVRSLVDAGADIHYKRDHGYDALIDAVHGRDIARDAHLLELLALLVERRVDLSGTSSYGESGLRVLSRIGRFDAVRLLLDAGADKRHLEWTPLMQAVALGALADVQAILTQGPDLETRDFWSRSAWLIALLVGDIAKATLLRDHGADTNARGRCGATPLSYAIRGHHPKMLRWLLELGADIHATDDFGTTALITSVEEDDFECVNILLEAGADVDVDANGTALSRATSREIILGLLAAGADPAELSHDGKRSLLGLPDVNDDALVELAPDDFRAGYKRVFGKANPERMHVPFWDAMIRSGTNAYAPRDRFAATCGATTEAVWCAQRFGQSLTFLPDGRAIQIGGEHEDFYDQDFCIYNDVFVHEKDGSIAVYGYPESVFPPTDFHTATLMGEFIYVIGSAGYAEHRQIGTTLVYRLHIHTRSMERLDTLGEAPGSIYKHRALAISPHEIRVWGGKTITKNGSEEVHEDNRATFVLDVSTLVWRRDEGKTSESS